jgi:hypothetical protein
MSFHQLFRPVAAAAAAGRFKYDVWSKGFIVTTMVIGACVSA